MTTDINDLVRICYESAKAKGFWDKPRNRGEAYMLFITEIAEAFEDIRKHGVHKQSEHIPDYSVEEEELADVCIRIFDWAGGIGLRLGSAINAKLEFNGNRPHLHGKLF